MFSLEDAIGQPDISKSVQRFQFGIQEAKVKLDLAISPIKFFRFSSNLHQL